MEFENAEYNKSSRSTSNNEEIGIAHEGIETSMSFVKESATIEENFESRSRSTSNNEEIGIAHEGIETSMSIVKESASIEEIFESRSRSASNNEEIGIAHEGIKTSMSIVKESATIEENFESRLGIVIRENSILHQENIDLKQSLFDKHMEVALLQTSLSNSEEKGITLQKANNELKHQLQNLSRQLSKCDHRCQHEINKVNGAQRTIRKLTNTIDDQNKDERAAIVKLYILDKEKKDLENQLRSNESEVELLHNSLKAERTEHESAMKRLYARCTKMQTELEKCKDANLNLLVKLDHLHNYSKISFEESVGALLDKRFIEQKLDDERAKEEDLAEETTHIIKKFASAKDRHGLIKFLKKRIEKESFPSPADKEFPLDEDSDMDHDTTVIHAHSDNKYCKERLAENKTTKNCHNKTEKNTNVFNIHMNIADSKISFIDKKEEQTLRLNGGGSDHKAIEGNKQL